jgi:hypothetical protein
MEIFEELRAAYRASQDAYRDYARASLVAAHDLAHRFREYLGAPETYPDPEDETRRPYVRLLAFQFQEDGSPVAAQPESQADLLARDPDGFWRFAMALTIDRDAESFPKQQLAFFLRLKLHGGVRHIQLLDDGVQDFRIAEPGSVEERALFDRMAGMVKRLLHAKPWEGVEKLPIGFELHRPNPEPEDENPTVPEAP